MEIGTTETKEILGYKTNQATIEFGGRKWIAWYTKEIPVQDGPYKFNGLPGLILKITDDKNLYDFEAKGITKESTDLSQRNYHDKIMEISTKQWNIFWDKYKKEPSIVLENLNTTNTTFVIDGKDVSTKEVKDRYNKNEWDAMKNFENAIELKSDCQ